MLRHQIHQVHLYYQCNLHLGYLYNHWHQLGQWLLYCLHNLRYQSILHYLCIHLHFQNIRKQKIHFLNTIILPPSLNQFQLHATGKL